MADRPEQRPAGSLRLVLITVFGPLAFFFGAMALSNATDVLARAGIGLGVWRSRNVAYAESVLAHVGWGPELGFWVVLGATLCEGLAALGFLVAAARLIVGRPGVVPAVRVGSAGAFLGMIGLAWGIEGFLVFEVADWSKNVIAAGLAGVAWIGAEMTLRDADGA
ncbi:MAG: hypothetical protein ACKOTZ_07195 [Chloroflexota bacterium]